MYNVEFVKVPFGGYRTEDVDSYINDLLNHIVELEQGERKLAEQAKRYENDYALLQQQRAEVEKRLSQIGDTSEVEHLRNEVTRLSQQQNQFENLKLQSAIQLQQANETITHLRDQVDYLSSRENSQGEDVALMKFLDKFSADFTEIFKKGQRISKEHQQAVKAEIDALKVQTETEVKKLREGATLQAETLVKNAEKEAHALVASAEETNARATTEAAAILDAANQESERLLQKAREEESRVSAIAAKAIAIAQAEAGQIVNKAKAEGADIIDRALFESAEIQAELEVEKANAKSQGERIIARAQVTADEIIDEARATAEETVKEAEYKLALAKERGDKILSKAEEKVGKQIADAQNEYNELRTLIEKSLARYRNLTNQPQVEEIRTPQAVDKSSFATEEESSLKS